MKQSAPPIHNKYWFFRFTPNSPRIVEGEYLGQARLEGLRVILCSAESDPTSGFGEGLQPVSFL